MEDNIGNVQSPRTAMTWSSITCRDVAVYIQ